jgi:hypothetical protein
VILPKKQKNYYCKIFPVPVRFNSVKRHIYKVKIVFYFVIKQLTFFKQSFISKYEIVLPDINQENFKRVFVYECDINSYSGKPELKPGDCGALFFCTSLTLS